MSLHPRSQRRSTALVILRTATVFSALAALAEVICIAAVPDLIVPEGALLPALVVYAFAASSWLIGALFVVGFTLCIGVPRPAPVCGEGALGAVLFGVAVALLPRVGLFL